jgi:hypothetical protein
MDGLQQIAALTPTTELNGGFTFDGGGVVTLLREGTTIKVTVDGWWFDADDLDNIAKLLQLTAQHMRKDLT